MAAAGSLPSILQAQTKPTPTKPTTRPLPDNIVWHDVRDWGIEGRAFDDTQSYFDRLPARAKGVVRPEVWNLARDSAGMSVRFEATTDALYIRYELNSPTLAMSHMPATGVSGVDLYTLVDNQWRWAATHQPTAQTIAAALVPHMPAEARKYQINFPLYNGVKKFEIGLPPSATFMPTPPRKDKPILFYGTSVTQGGCASRPGMAFTHILGRRLNRPMLNFGFSGNGRMEVEVAKFLAELDPEIFVLDCLANMGNIAVTERTEAVVKLLRASHSNTPILILEERLWGDASILPERTTTHIQRCAELRAAYDHLVAAGVPNLHYRKGDDLIGTDGEATVDGSHPSDLGMQRYADALEKDLKELLQPA